MAEKLSLLSQTINYLSEKFNFFEFLFSLKINFSFFCVCAARAMIALSTHNLNRAKEKSPIYKKILYLYQRSTKLNFTLFKRETEDN